MWIRRCEVDARARGATAAADPDCFERRVHPAAAVAAAAGSRRGRWRSPWSSAAPRVSRRDFLRTGSGMAAALVAMNQVFGPCYAVEAAEIEDQAAFQEKWPKGEFIFDVQTHHVDVDTPKRGHSRRAGGEQLLPRPSTRREGPEGGARTAEPRPLRQGVFDSDTVMAIISGVPTATWEHNPLPPDQMVATRKHVNDLAGSQRVLSHGLLRPNNGKPELDELERQVKTLKIDAWKTYTGMPRSERTPGGWMTRRSPTCSGRRRSARGPQRLRPQRAAADLQRGSAGRAIHKAAVTGPVRTSSSTTPFPRLPAAAAERAEERRPAGDPGSANSSGSAARTPGCVTSTSNSGAPSARPSAYAPEVSRMLGQMLYATRRRGPDPLGHRLDLDREPAEPDRPPPPPSDQPRSWSRSTATRRYPRDPGQDLRIERRAVGWIPTPSGRRSGPTRLAAARAE